MAARLRLAASEHPRAGARRVRATRSSRAEAMVRRDEEEDAGGARHCAKDLVRPRSTREVHALRRHVDRASPRLHRPRAEDRARVDGCAVWRSFVVHHALDVETAYQVGTGDSAHRAARRDLPATLALLDVEPEDAAMIEQFLRAAWKGAARSRNKRPSCWTATVTSRDKFPMTTPICSLLPLAALGLIRISARLEFRRGSRRTSTCGTPFVRAGSGSGVTPHRSCRRSPPAAASGLPLSRTARQLPPSTRGAQGSGREVRVPRGG